jgi:integrase
MEEGMSASARNNYRESMVAMSNWAIDVLGLSGNPFARIPKANEKADPRHERRALTIQEMQKLLEAAEKRPLHDKLKVTRGNLKGQAFAKIGDDVAAKAKRTGMERRLIYAFLVYTGLRKKELSSITINQVFLDEKQHFLLLKAKDAKSKCGAEIPICEALMKPLHEWLDVRKSEGKLKPGDKLFNVPKALDKVLNLDLVFAGIEKRDRRDRVIDVHALRHTHATLLKQFGVAQHVAKESMRHSDIALTMNVYTHSGLDDVANGVNLLPDLLNGNE